MGLKGITVKLYQKIQTGTDGFGKPTYEETAVEVENVLVAPTLSDDVVNVNDLTGKKAVYTLAIPKGDTHVWTDRKVTFFGQDWRTFGEPIQGIEENIPLSWNVKVMVEHYA